jgi:hypothetical protein
MRLNPDLDLLERIGILSNPFRPFIQGGYQMELMEKDFESLSPFLIQWGGAEALQELFFYQLNFCDPPKQKWKFLNELREEQENIKNLKKFNFSQLKRITLEFTENEFEKGEKINLNPEIVKYLKGIIENEIENSDPQSELKKLKDFEKEYENKKLKIQKALSSVEAILKAKSPEATFDLKQVILSTYAIFYQRGHRLDFRGETDPEETNPNFPDSFNHIRVYDILRRE